MEQHTISDRGPELQSDDIFHDLHLLTPEAIRDDAGPIKTDYIGPWKTKTMKKDIQSVILQKQR